MTERLHFHFSLSCIGEGNGNPLQCSCLENPRDVGAWWAAVSGVTQSRTRLKRLSSSSSLSSQMTAQKFRRRSTVTGSGAASWRRLYLWQLEEVLGKSISLGAAACFYLLLAVKSILSEEVY